MANACILHNNLFDAATVTVSGALALAGASKLQNPHVGAKCRVNASNMTIAFDLGSPKSWDTVALPGVFVSGGTGDISFRVKGDNTDGTVGDVIDSGALTGTPNFDTSYGLFVWLRSATASARYGTIAISRTSASYIEAGLGVVGARNQFGINFGAGWSRGPVRRSVDALGVGGQTFIDLREGAWRVNAPFQFVSDTQAKGFLEEIAVAIVNNGHCDMLWIEDPDSTNLSRDCLWGFHEGDWPRVQEALVVPAAYNVTFNLVRRG